MDKIITFLESIKIIPYWDRVPAISDAELESLITEVKKIKE